MQNLNFLRAYALSIVISHKSLVTISHHLCVFFSFPSKINRIRTLLLFVSVSVVHKYTPGSYISKTHMQFSTISFNLEMYN